MNTAPLDTLPWVEQISSKGTEDLLYLVVADHPRKDIFHYPDSGE
ncbi:hypothetical protein [Roseimicrobium sp. ORNL1]|nr:hypothetical protein [Roseimicrobium sp. ORNL1]